MRGDELLACKLDLLPGFPRLPLGVGLCVPKSFASSPPQRDGRERQNNREYRNPRPGILPPSVVLIACGIGGCAGCCAVAVICWPYKKKPRKFNRDNRENEG